ncbi:MAG: S1-like domain-containing RNA-binding protein [Lachnospiraceae bacterium]|nr:S1-like domain-containing RNA-binding protein [Lachnospiraceae bacterium]
MFKLGEKQTLIVINKAEQGVYLGEKDGATDKVLLPKKQCPENLRPGDKIEVFIYLDSQDRIIATVREPKLMMGGFALLKVAGVNKIGAFMDWGLEKDLFLPFKQQTVKVKEGEEVLCALYIDKSGRLCATMKVYDYLKTTNKYSIGDEVTGRVYEISDNFGAFVAVDDMYSALIPKKEMFGKIKVGDVDAYRVIAVREDGKLTLANRKPAYLQIDEDAIKVLKVIEEFDGVLPFNDKASPEVIKREFNMSKNEFKRAVGKLYKERKIEITEKAIRIL